MLALYPTLVSAQQPALQQRRYPMHSGQQSVRFLAAPSNNPFPMDVACGFEAQVRRKAIGDYHAAAGDALLHEGFETVGRGVGDNRQPNSTDTLSIHLSGNGYESLLAYVATAPALFDAPYEGFIDLNVARKLIATRAHHRPPQFMEPSPRCLIAAETQDSLESQGAGAVLLGDHPPHHLKPQAQGLPRSMEEGAGCCRCLVSALHAVHLGFLGQPRLMRRTSGTAKTLRPPQVRDVLSASILCGEVTVEFGERSGIVRINHANILSDGVT